ncbi:MAG: DUF2279 domain-containing protein [Chitinophagaceae bacterium]|nr:DUF2279 domain-containing protein [Chitinophagaceae bacterium]
MRSSPVLLSSSLASHTSSFCPLLGLLILFCALSNNLRAQKDTTRFNKTELSDTKNVDNPDNLRKFLSKSNIDSNFYLLTPQQKKKRTWLVATGNVIGYGTTMIGLYSAWYKDYPQTGFHSFNDWPEWKQVDKVGHLYSAYIESRASMELWRWTGIDRKKRIWIGGMSGAFYQTVIEVLDGFSAGWGWSWADFGANIMGSGALVAQEFAWNDQRIKLKFSFHNKNYNDPALNSRSDELFGNSTAQRFIKDYNGQTYWASANLKSFFPKSNLPPWLSVSLGYGAEGLLGGTENVSKDVAGNIVFNRPDIKRYRQWYLAPDIDLSKIKTKSKPLKFFLTFLSAFKFPAPALEFSNGKFKVHAIYF